MTSYASRVSALLPGGDPTPGDIGEVLLIADRLQRAVDAVADVKNLLRSVSHSDLWAGPAADAFAAHHRDLVAKLDGAHDAYTQATGVVRRWVRELEAAQAEATHLVSLAQAAAQAAGFPPGPVPPALTALRRRHEVLGEQARADAQRCANDLQSAINEVGRFAHSVWEHVTEELVTVSKVLEDMNVALGVLAIVALLFMPGVGEVVGAAMLVGSAAELGVDVVLATDGKKTWGDVGLDAAGVALGGGAGVARTATRAAEGASELRFAARSAAGKAGWLGREADQAAAVGAEDSQEVYRAAQAAFRRQGAEFRAEAKTLDQVNVGGLVRDTHDEVGYQLRNPIAAARDGVPTGPAVAAAKAYGELPNLRLWQESPIRHTVDAVLRVADPGYETVKPEIADAMHHHTGQGERK